VLLAFQEYKYDNVIVFNVVFRQWAERKVFVKRIFHLVVIDFLIEEDWQLLNDVMTNLKLTSFLFHFNSGYFLLEISSHSQPSTNLIGNFLMFKQLFFNRWHQVYVWLEYSHSDLMDQCYSILYFISFIWNQFTHCITWQVSHEDCDVYPNTTTFRNYDCFRLALIDFASILQWLWLYPN